MLVSENNFVLSATKHGNGKSWWICTNQALSNCYNLMYYDGTSNISITSHCEGGEDIEVKVSPLIFPMMGTNLLLLVLVG